MDLYLVKDENYKFVVRAYSWSDAIDKTLAYCENTLKITLRRSNLDAYILDNKEIIE